MEKKQDKDIRAIHFVGIAGVGMSALAIFCKERGMKVTGSDDGKEYVTWKTLKQAGISWKNGFDAANVPQDCDLVVATNAHSGFTTNPETCQAQKLGKKIVSLRQAIAHFAKDYKVIAVAGTHGKTTTAAMIATILYKAGLDPSWVPIGTAAIPTLPSNGHAGQGEWFITEADEYFDRPKELGGKANFLYFQPQLSVITSVDWDHPDVYPTEKHYFSAFKKFIKQVRPDGLIVAYGDSDNVRKLAKSARAHVWWYGRDRLWPNMELQVIGLANKLNATAAARIAHEVGVDQATIITALSEFRGSERRLEKKGERNGIVFLDDYAHHPVEIQITLSGVKEAFPHRRLVAVFQPHTFSRTQALLKEFAQSFRAADLLYILDIWGSAREKVGNISSADLVKETEKYTQDVKYLPGSLDEAAVNLRGLLKPGDILLTMGATDIYKLHDLLKSHGPS